MGKVKIKQRNGNQWLLKEVKHVPDLSKNLISTGQLASEGCISIFTDKTWKVIKGSLVIAKGEKVGTLYLCTGNTDSSIYLASTGVDIALWHHRLGHMSENEKLENGSFIIFLLYVDDMLVAGTNMQDINVLKKKLANSFAMKDLGAAKKILGMRIIRDRKNHKLTLSQGEYTEKVLERFRMQNAKPVSTPLASHFKLTKEMCPKTQEEIEYMSRVPYSSAVGSLMYAMVCTRPDIAHAMGVVSRYMNNPGKEHWEAVKCI
jgi:hypothetical protein